MSNAPDLDLDAYVRSLVGHAYPAPEDVPSEAGLFRRRWMVRVSQKLGEGSALQAATEGFERRARAEIRRSYGDVAAEAQPRAGVARIDDHHVVLEIDCPKPPIAVGDVAAIVTWVVLRAADREWGIEDLQGIPRRYWFQLK